MQYEYFDSATPETPPPALSLGQAELAFRAADGTVALYEDATRFGIVEIAGPFRSARRCRGVRLSLGGSVLLAISTPAIGSRSITATYQGDKDYGVALSPSIIEVIQDISRTITNPNATIQHGSVAGYDNVVSSVGGAGLASTIQLSFNGGPDRSERRWRL